MKAKPGNESLIWMKANPFGSKGISTPVLNMIIDWEEGNTKNKRPRSEKMKWKSRERLAKLEDEEAGLSRWAGWANKTFNRSNKKVLSISAMVTWQKNSFPLDNFLYWREHSIWGSYSHFITCLIFLIYCSDYSIPVVVWMYLHFVKVWNINYLHVYTNMIVFVRFKKIEI